MFSHICKQQTNINITKHGVPKNLDSEELKILNLDAVKLLSSKNLQREPLQDGEVFEVREAPSIPGDNHLYLSVTMSWFQWSWPICTSSC